jgi:hypothetical protein
MYIRVRCLLDVGFQSDKVCGWKTCNILTSNLIVSLLAVIAVSIYWVLSGQKVSYWALDLYYLSLFVQVKNTKFYAMTLFFDSKQNPKSHITTCV